jgi:hypothetical protein
MRKEITANDKKSSITTVTGWKEKANTTYMLTLPSGAVVRIRRLNLLEQASIGHIPLHLVSSSMLITQKFSNPSKWVDIEPEELDNLMQVLKKTTVLAVVEPKVSEEETEDEMNVNDIPMEDLISIFSSVMNPVGANLEPFRPE